MAKGVWTGKNSTVQLGSLDERLRDVLTWLGIVHTALFGKPLVVTSGNDGKHSANSKHYRNLAIDVRSYDKTPQQQMVWAAVLAMAVDEYKLAVFDERQRPGAPHWHIEVA